MTNWLGFRVVIVIVVSVGVVLFVLFALLLTLDRGGDPVSTRSPPAMDSVPEGFVSVNLSISNAPAMGRVATLNANILANAQSPNLSARIDLPPGLQAVGPNPVWSGTLERGQSASFRVPVRAVAVGEWVVELKAGTLTGGDIAVEDIDRLHLTIGQDESKVSETQPPPPVGQEAIQIDEGPAPPPTEDAMLPEPYEP